jgi:hypothetical protein
MRPGNDASVPSRRRLTAALVTALGLCLAAGPARAFNSYPPGAPHDQITQSAGGYFGFFKRALDELCRAVRYPDRSESRWAPRLLPWTWLRFVPNKAYRPAHHFDRAAGIGDADAFLAGAAYVEECMTRSVTFAEAGDRTAAIASTGAALHAYEDLWAHSNLVDLDDSLVSNMQAGVLSGRPSPPPGLKITGYSARARNPEFPPGDEYPHGAFAKDSPKKNAECRKRIGDETKYERAKRLAITGSVALLARLKSRMSESAWTLLLGR